MQKGILLWGVEDQIPDLIVAAQDIVDQPVSALERLWQVMKLYLDYLVDNKEFYLKLSFEVQKRARKATTYSSQTPRNHERHPGLKICRTRRR